MTDDKIEVYHSGTEIIDKPLCDFGRPKLDFGEGFYLTDIYSQAQIWALIQADKRKEPPIITVYILERGKLIENARCKFFEGYDEEWLDFIVDCRSGGESWKKYDYIEGAIADDRVIDTVNIYMQGFLSKQEALQRLKYLKPNNQICITNQNILDRFLHYDHSVNLSDI